jgi:hypothetical protein
MDAHTQCYWQVPETFHKIGKLEWRKGLQHATHTYKEKFSMFICMYRGGLVSSLAARGAGWITNGSDGSRQGFLLVREHSRLWLCNEVFGPSSERTRRWGTATCSGMKNSSVTGACALQNAQDDKVLRRKEWSVWGMLFNADPARPLTEQIELGIPQPTLWQILRKPLFPSARRMLQSFPTFNCTDFLKCVRESWTTLYSILQRDKKCIQMFCWKNL